MSWPYGGRVFPWAPKPWRRCQTRRSPPFIHVVWRADSQESAGRCRTPLPGAPASSRQPLPWSLTVGRASACTHRLVGYSFSEGPGLGEGVRPAGRCSRKIVPVVHPPSITPSDRYPRSQLQSGCLRHKGASADRCFLPDLTGLGRHPFAQDPTFNTACGGQAPNDETSGGNSVPLWRIVGSGYRQSPT